MSGILKVAITSNKRIDATIIRTLNKHVVSFIAASHVKPADNNHFDRFG